MIMFLFLIDVNECEPENICDYPDLCIDHKIGFECSCPDGYQLNDDKHTCSGKSSTIQGILSCTLYPQIFCSCLYHVYLCSEVSIGLFCLFSGSFIFLLKQYYKILKCAIYVHFTHQIFWSLLR